MRQGPALPPAAAAERAQKRAADIDIEEAVLKAKIFRKADVLSKIVGERLKHCSLMRLLILTATLAKQRGLEQARLDVAVNSSRRHFDATFEQLLARDNYDNSLVRELCDLPPPCDTYPVLEDTVAATLALTAVEHRAPEKLSDELPLDVLRACLYLDKSAKTPAEIQINSDAANSALWAYELLKFAGEVTDSGEKARCVAQAVKHIKRIPEEELAQMSAI